MFVNCHAPTFQALLTICMYKFRWRLTESRNGIIAYLTDPSKSETIYSQSLWKYWNHHLYVFQPLGALLSFMVVCVLCVCFFIIYKP